MSKDFFRFDEEEILKDIVMILTTYILINTHNGFKRKNNFQQIY